MKKKKKLPLETYGLCLFIGKLQSLQLYILTRELSRTEYTGPQM